MNNYDPEWDGNQWLENEEDEELEQWFNDDYGSN